MKYSIPLFFAIVFFGCSDPSENAPLNLKKGDEFYMMKEYEIAEYYYEKIPEESPIYKRAQKRLIEIEKIKKLWAQVPDVKKVDLTKIVILEHTYLAVGNVPVHRISLVNKSAKVLDMVEIEFSYFDKEGKLVDKIPMEVDTKMNQNTQDVFKNIAPGLVKGQFVRSSAKILTAKFQ